MKVQIQSKKSSLFKLAFYLCLALITILSILPDDEELGPTIPKLTESGFFIHAAAYLIVTIAGFLAYRFFPKRITIFVLCYSTFLEWVQKYIPQRSFNYWDIIANIIGILVAVFIILLVRKNVKEESL